MVTSNQSSTFSFGSFTLNKHPEASNTFKEIFQNKTKTGSKIFDNSVTSTNNILNAEWSQQQNNSRGFFGSEKNNLPLFKAPNIFNKGNVVEKDVGSYSAIFESSNNYGINKNPVVGSGFQFKIDSSPLKKEFNNDNLIINNNLFDLNKEKTENYTNDEMNRKRKRYHQNEKEEKEEGEGEGDEKKIIIEKNILFEEKRKKELEENEKRERMKKQKEEEDMRIEMEKKKRKEEKERKRREMENEARLKQLEKIKIKEEMEYRYNVTMYLRRRYLHRLILYLFSGKRLMIN